MPKEAPIKHPLRRYALKATAPENPFIAEVALRDNRVDEFIASLNDQELSDLLRGHNDRVVAQTNSIGINKPEFAYNLGRDLKRVPMIPTCDGPAGLRVGASVWNMDTTFFPVANTVSQTWNLKLAEKMGKAAALEIAATGIPSRCPCLKDAATGLLHVFPSSRDVITEISCSSECL